MLLQQQQESFQGFDRCHAIPRALCADFCFLNQIITLL